MERIHTVQHAHADAERAEAQAGQQTREDRSSPAKQPYEQGSAPDDHD